MGKLANPGTWNSSILETNAGLSKSLQIPFSSPILAVIALGLHCHAPTVRAAFWQNLSSVAVRQQLVDAHRQNMVAAFAADRRLANLTGQLKG